MLYLLCPRYIYTYRDVAESEGRWLHADVLYLLLTCFTCYALAESEGRWLHLTLSLQLLHLTLSFDERQIQRVQAA